MKRFKDVMKDEEGLTLVELLAVVVILAVIAGIGALGIGKIIQNAREDAAVGSIQMATSAAQLYDTQNGHAAFATPVSAKELTDQGLIKSVTFNGAEKLTFTKAAAEDPITVIIEKACVKAGSKENDVYKAVTTGKGSSETTMTDEFIQDLGRDNIFY